MKIQVYTKNVYGNDLIYPCLDDENAVAFSALVDRKTFTKEHIDIIKTLGFEIEQVVDSSIKIGE